MQATYLSQRQIRIRCWETAATQLTLNELWRCLLTQVHVRLLLVTVLFCCLEAPGSGSPASGLPGTVDTGTLSGEVADSVEGVPIPYAFVFTHNNISRRDNVLKLGTSGQFEVLLPPGVYSVFVAAPGFAPSCKAVAVVAGHVTKLSTRLSADAEHLEQSSKE
jgi:carboxypeptidase family protein